MEKLKKHISKGYLPVKIYIDDLEKIVAILDDNSIKNQAFSFSKTFPINSFCSRSWA